MKSTAANRIPPRVRVLVWGLLLLLVAVLLVMSASVRRELLTRYAAVEPRFSPALRLAPDLPPAALAEIAVPTVERFRRGSTLQRLFEQLGLEAEEAWQATQVTARRLDPRKLRAGDRYAAYYGPSDRLVAFAWTVPGEGRLWLERADALEGWRERWEPAHKSVQRRVVEGELDGSLEGSIVAAGGPATLAYAMADVLQWDLDFNRDLRTGDRFAVIYDELRVDGRVQGIAGVEALVYLNRGRALEAYRFGDENGYYDAEGRPLRKQFLRSPLKFSRVTSRFSHRRFHPVLKRYRPHYGVDYGAPTGTPVRVTANGVVASAAFSKGGGKTVAVRHPNGYVTHYLHLSGYAAGIRSGARVSQGDVIGYVGATGLATGPHLDYRVKHNGQWIDPLSLAERNPPAEPIPEDQLVAFASARDRLRSQFGLAGLGEAPVLLARAETQAGGEEPTVAAAAVRGAVGSR